MIYKYTSGGTYQFCNKKEIENLITDHGAEIISEIQKRFDAALLAMREGNTARNAAELQNNAKSAEVSMQQARENTVIDLTDDTNLAKMVDGMYGSKKYKIIADYIYSVLGKDPITLSDGTKAIIDNRDVSHIAHGAGNKKVRAVAKIKDLVSQAVYYAYENDVEHNKFDSFKYYRAIAKFDNEEIPLYLNIGKGITDKQYHMYDVTYKIRDTANRINGLERPKPNEGYAHENDISNKIVSQENKKVNTSSKNNKILYQNRDADYLDAVNRGDMKTAQRLVDEAARKAGYTIKAYHGTPSAEFTVFDKNRVGKGNDQYGAGFYFTTDKAGASHYGNRVIDATLNINNPIRFTSTAESGRNLIDADIMLTSDQAYEVVKRLPNIYDAEESPLGDYFDTYWEVGAKDWMIRELAEQYRDVGYLDSDLFRNYPNELHEALRDVVGYDGVEVTFERTGEKFYVAWFDNQMKSTEPITYDDNGNVIPLSERFNERNPDIRYQDRDEQARYSLKDAVIPTREELEAKPPIAVVDLSKPKTHGTFAERRRKILDSIDDIISRPYLNEDTKTWIFITKKSYTHSFNNLGDMQLNATENIPDLIKNAVLTHVEDSDHGDTHADLVYTFFAAAKYDNNVLPVKLKVKEYTYSGQSIPQNIKNYFKNHPQDYSATYDTIVLEVEEMKKSPIGSVKNVNEFTRLNPTELSDISIADLLALVKGESKKYIPDYENSSTNQLLNIDSFEPPQPTSETAFDGSTTDNSILSSSEKVNTSFSKNQKIFQDRIETPAPSEVLRKYFAGNMI